MARLLFGLLFLVMICVPAQASKRVALVVGNSAYEHVPELANPKNDAEAVANALDRLDFEVIRGIDLTQPDFVNKVREFSKAIRGADIALFYYAGHGLQVNGRNYLAPVETQLLDEADLDFEAVRLQMILSQMEREPRTNLVILDACRNNPLARNLAGSMGTRSAAVGRGLAPIESGIGTLIAFATQPGNVALDGEGSNSPFTSALVKHLDTPGEDIAVTLRRVRQDVIIQTDGKQVPWSNSSLTGSVVLKPAAQSASTIVDEGDAVELRKQLTALRQELAEAQRRFNDEENGDKIAPPSNVSGAERNDDFGKIAALPKSDPTNTIEDESSGVLNPESQSVVKPDDATRDYEIAEKLDTERGWQLYFRKHGAKSQLDELSLASLSDEENSRSLNPGIRVERIIGLDNFTRKTVQERLNQRGVSAGVPDGVFGTNSRNAIGEFQRREGLEETGYVNFDVLKRLGIDHKIEDTGDFKSSKLAKKYQIDDLRALGENKKVTDAIACLKQKIIYADYPIIYGRFNDHYYIAVGVILNTFWSDIFKLSKECGGYVTTISTPAENRFVYELVASDSSFWRTKMGNGGLSIMGPVIGLVRNSALDKPGAGWSWSNGEKSNYRRWRKGEPNNRNGTENYTGLFTWTRDTNAFGKIRADLWYDTTMHGNGFIMELE